MAISFAGPDREIAEQLAHLLRDAGLRVFYDLFEQERIWGTRLYSYLAEVYETKARYCIVLISSDYRNRVWPRHELRSAFNRAVRERREYILPVRLDDAVIEDLPQDLAYISLRTTTIQNLADLVRIKAQLSSWQSERAIAGIFSNRSSGVTAVRGKFDNPTVTHSKHEGSVALRAGTI